MSGPKAGRIRQRTRSRRRSMAQCPNCGTIGASLRRLLRPLGFALLAVLFPLLSRAEISATAFEAANKLYEEGKYSEAATAYAKLLQTG